MKKINKLLSVCFITSIFTLTLFAQSNDNTSINLNALTNYGKGFQNQSTDVQYYSDISENNFSQIKIDSKRPNLSLATSGKLGSVYLGSYLSGSLWGKSQHILIKQNELEAQSEYKDNFINGEALIGSNNFAGKMNFGVLINENSTKTPVNASGNTYDNSIQTLLTLGGELGGSFNFNKITWKPVLGYTHANSLIYSYDSKNQKDNQDLEVKANIIRIGSDFIIKGQKETNHKIGTQIFITIPTIKPRDTTKTYFPDIKTSIPIFEPYYENIYENEKVCIKSKVDMIIGGGKVKALDPTSQEIIEEMNIFLLTPSFDIDCAYNVNNENFILNLGANVILPYYIKLSEADHVNRTTLNETITSDIVASFRTGFDLLLSKKASINLNTAIPLSPTLSKTIIDNISLSFTFRK